MLIVNLLGACGRMGSEVIRAITKDSGTTVVGAVDKHRIGVDIGTYFTKYFSVACI